MNAPAASPVDPEALLQAARDSGAPKEDLEPYKPAILALREKGYTWRQVSAFLSEKGLKASHVRVFRLMKGAEFVVPEARDYVEALQALKEEKAVSTEVMAMLRFHWSANNRTATFTELAQAAADAGPRRGKVAQHTEANLGYGAFAAKLGSLLGMSLASNGRGGVFACSAIGFENPYKTKTSHVQLVMHHELAKALELLGWVH